jgi:hypothetical protein
MGNSVLGDAIHPINKERISLSPIFDLTFIPANTTTFSMTWRGDNKRLAPALCSTTQNSNSEKVATCCKRSEAFPR